MILRSACTALLLSTTSVLASAPKVVTDIPPVQSLVAMVMGQLGMPDALVAAGASAHDMALRPSQAQTLSEAELVIWIGPQMSPGFADQLETLAPDAQHIALIDAEGAILLPFRGNALFDLHDDHDDDEHDGDDHAEDEHADDGHDEYGHDAHDHHDHAGEDGEAAIDPHLWLSPDNALVWVPQIAQALAALDDANKAVYLRNAATAVEDIKAAKERAKATLLPVQDIPLAAYHDAFQYYEQAFGLQVIGAISDSDAVQPGPKRIDALRTAFAADEPVCFLMEPGANAQLLTSVGYDALLNSDTGKEPIARIDPLGGELPAGPSLYPALIEDIAGRIANCVTGQ